MKWCPNCHAEYEDFATECSDCGVALVTEPIDAQNRDLGEPVLLTTVYNHTVSDMLQSLLRSQDIPTLEKHLAPEYLMLPIADASQGIELYVSQAQLETAKALLEGLEGEPLAGEFEGLDEEYAEDMTLEMEGNAETDD